MTPGPSSRFVRLLRTAVSLSNQQTSTRRAACLQYICRRNSTTLGPFAVHTESTGTLSYFQRDIIVRHFASLPESSDPHADADADADETILVNADDNLNPEMDIADTKDEENLAKTYDCESVQQLADQSVQWQQLRAKLFDSSSSGDEKQSTATLDDAQDFLLSVIQQARTNAAYNTNNSIDTSSSLTRQNQALVQLLQMLDDLLNLYQKHAQKNNNNNHHVNLKPLDSEILGQVLLLWKDFMLQRMRTRQNHLETPSSTTTTNVPQEKQQSSNIVTKSHNDNTPTNTPHPTFQSWITNDAFAAATISSSTDTWSSSQIIVRPKFSPRQIEDLLWQHALHPQNMQRTILKFTSPIAIASKASSLSLFTPNPLFYAIITHVLARTPPEPHEQVDAWVNSIEAAHAQTLPNNTNKSPHSNHNEYPRNESLLPMLPSLLYLEQLVAHRNMGNAGICDDIVRSIIDSTERPRDGHEVHLLTIALEAWAKVMSKHSTAYHNNNQYETRTPLLAAEELFELLQRTAKEDKCEIPVPAYHALMKAHIKSSHDNSSERCEELFQKLSRQGNRSNRHSTIGIDSYNHLLKAYAAAKTRLPKHFTRADKLYQEITESPHVTPDQTTFLCLLDMHAKAKASGKNGGAAATSVKRMEALFSDMKDTYDMQPSAAMYNRLLAAYAKLATRSNPKIVLRMQEIMDEMQAHDRWAPDIYCWNELMTAYSKNGEPQKVEEIYQLLLREFQAGHRAWEPNFHIHVTRLQAWSRAGKPTETQQALKDMTHMGFLNKLNVADSSTATTNADGTAAAPTRRTRLRVVTQVDPSSSSRTVEQRPSAIYFTALLSAWLRSGDSDAPEKALKGLRQMQEYARQGRFRCRPSPVSYATVISCFHRYKHPQAGEQALILLQEAKDQSAYYCADHTLVPHFNLYVQTLCALTVNSDPNDEDGVWSILEELRRRKNRGFWLANRGELSQWSFVKRDLANSSFASKDKMLETVKRLESRTLGHVGLKPPGKKARGKKPTRGSKQEQPKTTTSTSTAKDADEEMKKKNDHNTANEEEHP